MFLFATDLCEKCIDDIDQIFLIFKCLDRVNVEIIVLTQWDCDNVFRPRVKVIAQRTSDFTNLLQGNPPTETIKNILPFNTQMCTGKPQGGFAEKIQHGINQKCIWHKDDYQEINFKRKRVFV